jgi:hypothetical protein
MGRFWRVQLPLRWPNGSWRNCRAGTERSDRASSAASVALAVARSILGGRRRTAGSADRTAVTHCGNQRGLLMVACGHIPMSPAARIIRGKALQASEPRAVKAGLPIKVPLKTREGPLPGAGKGPVSCGAPLRNRTVDLLLTISTLRCNGRVSCTHATRERTDRTGSAENSRRPVHAPVHGRMCSS